MSALDLDEITNAVQLRRLDRDQAIIRPPQPAVITVTFPDACDFSLSKIEVSGKAGAVQA